MQAKNIELKSFPHPVRAVLHGASRGIGLAFVRALAASPSIERVFATCRDPAAARHLSTVAEAAGARATILPMNVEIEAEVERAAAQIAKLAGDVHLVINCFGVLHDGPPLQPERRLADVDPEAIARSFAVNTTGHLLVAKHFTPLLPRRGRSVFANLSARVGSIGDNRLGGWYSYRASKAAQNMITKTLSIELARRCPDCVCLALHPGTTATELSAPFTSRKSARDLFSRERAARQLLEVIDAAGAESNGCFRAWDGTSIEW